MSFATLKSTPDTQNITVNHVHIVNTSQSATIVVEYQRTVVTAGGTTQKYASAPIPPGASFYIGIDCAYASYTSLCTTEIRTIILGERVVRQYSLEELSTYSPT